MSKILKDFASKPPFSSEVLLLEPRELENIERKQRISSKLKPPPCQENKSFCTWKPLEKLRKQPKKVG